MSEVYQNGKMIIVRKPTDNGMEISGYAISQYDWIRMLDGKIKVVRKADGVVVAES